MHGLKYLVSSFFAFLFVCLLFIWRTWGELFSSSLLEAWKILLQNQEFLEGFLNPLASSIKITPKKAELQSFQIHGIYKEMLDIIQLNSNVLLKVCISLY